MVTSFPEWKADPAKRGILHKLASIYDQLGFVTPVTLVRKLAKQISMQAIVARGSRPPPGATANLSPGNFPVDRTQGSSPFQVNAVDYAEPINYKKGGESGGLSLHTL